MNIEKEAARLESMSVNKEGHAALQELQSLSHDDRLSVIKQMQQDARQEQGKVYIDKDQLVFDSVFKSAHQNY